VKVESLLLIIIGVFFGFIGVVYWVWGDYAFHLGDQAGSVMLAGTFLLGVVPGLYYLFWHRRFDGHKFFFWGRLDRKVGQRPEDRSDATIAEGAGTIDSFPGSSVWPFVLGGGAMLLVNGLVFGWWIAIPGIMLILIALVGVTAESRRGGHV
jgi:hypothetical protein